MAYSGAGPSSYGQLPGWDRGRIWLVAVIVVLLAAAGAAGGWFFLSHRSHPAPRVATAPATAAQPRTAGAGATSASGGGGGPAAQESASRAPVITASPQSSGLPVGQVGLVAIGPPANGPAAPHVAAFLSRYFTAINAKDYPAYRSMYDPTANPAQGEAGFRSGYRTTHDSAIVLVRLVPSGAGGWLATVTFTSSQAPSASPTGTSCTQWRVLYVLAPAGATFVLEHVPPGNHASALPCPS